MPSFFPTSILQEAPFVYIPLVEDSIEEAIKFPSSALVCQFNGLWRHLVDLHKWISKVWKPLIF